MGKRRFHALEFSLGMLLGMAVGAIIAILLAPLPGAEIRGRIADRAQGIKTTATDLIDHARHGIETAASQVEKIAGLQEKKLRRKLSEIKSQLEEYQLNEV